MNNEQTHGAIEGAALQTNKISAGIKTQLENLRGTIAQNNAIPSDIETYLSGIEAEANQLQATGTDLTKLANALAPAEAATVEEPQAQAADVDGAPERPNGAEEDTTASGAKRKK
jgi:hypothetical protein